MQRQLFKHSPGNKNTPTPSDRPSTTSSISSTLEDSSLGTSNHHPDGGVNQVIKAGRWKWSKPRQIAFWVKKSIRDAVSPDLSCVYETSPSSSQRLSSKSGRPAFNVNSFLDKSPISKIIGEDHEHDSRELDNTEEEESYSFPPCQNIDQAMFALHTFEPNQDDEDFSSYAQHNLIYNEYFSHPDEKGEGVGGRELYHDWLLDGDRISDTDLSASRHPKQSQQHNSISHPANRIEKKKPTMLMKIEKKEFGDLELDSAIARMELEPCFSCNDKKVLVATENIANSVKKMDDDEIKLSKKCLNEECSANDGVDRIKGNDDTVITPVCEQGVRNREDSSLIRTESDEKNDNKCNELMHKVRQDSVSCPKYITCGKGSNDNEGSDFQNELSSSLPDIPERFIATSYVIPDNDIFYFPNPWSHCLLDSQKNGTICQVAPETTQLFSRRLKDTLSPESKFTRRLQLQSEEAKNSMGAMMKSTPSESVKLSSEEEMERSHSSECESFSSEQEHRSIDENESQSNKEDEEDEENSLPPGYYTMDFDPLLDIMNSIPWESDETPSNNDNIDTFLSQTLSNLDEVSGKVTQKLINQISDKEEEINAGMKIIQEVDRDVRGSLSYIKHANIYLQRARGREAQFRSTTFSGACGQGKGGGRGLGILGGIQVIEEAEKRDRLREVDSVLSRCEKILEMDRCVTLFCKTEIGNFTSKVQEFERLISKCTELKSLLVTDEQLLQLTCFNGLRYRASHALESMRRYLDDCLIFFLSKRCHHSVSPAVPEKWDDDCRTEYSTLLNTHYMLHEIQMLEMKEIMESNNAGQDDSGRKLVQLPNAASSWSSCVSKALCFEVDKAFARALLDPTRSASDVVEGEDEEPSEFDQNLLEIRMKISKIQANDEDAASLRSLTHNLMVIRFQFEHHKYRLPWVFHKLCALLANIFHTHYILTQLPQIPSGTEPETLTKSDRCNSPVDNESEKGGQFVDSVEPIGAEQRHAVSNSSQDGVLSVSSHPTSLPSPKRPCQLQSVESTKHQVVNDVPKCISATNDDVNESSMNFERKAELDKFSLQNQEESERNRLLIISEEVLKSRLQLWKHCENVLTHLLETSTSLSSGGNGTNSDSIKILLLEQLHDLLHLSNQIISLVREFLGSEICEQEGILPLIDFKCKCKIKENICDIYQKFLRETHVEAMTDMGTILANESWQLIPCPLKIPESTESTSKFQAQQWVECMLRTNSPPCIDKSKILDCTKSRTWQNLFYSHETSAFLPNYFSLGNPFISKRKVNNNMCNDCSPILSHSGEEDSECDTSSTELRCNIYEKVASCIEINATEVTIATKSSVRLVKWIALLLEILEKLPIINEDVSVVICNLFDLYFLTVFRLCVGNAKRESIILGLENRSDSFHIHEVPVCSPPCNTRRLSDRIGRKRNSGTDSLPSAPIPKLSVPKHIEAEIYSPLRSENDVIEKVKVFVLRGQTSLSKIVNLDKIEGWSTVQHATTSNVSTMEEEMLYGALILQKQIISSFSCLFVCCILDRALIHVKRNVCLPSFQALFVECSDTKLNASLFIYWKQMLDAITHMHLLCMRMSAISAINGGDVVNRIISIGDGWTEGELNESSNDYVESLAKRCALIWGHMSISSFMVQESMLLQAWDHIIESGFLCMLEGFSKVFCSTEGRALMSIDLATFCSNVDGRVIIERLESHFDSVVKLPPSSSPLRGMQYVDLYIKVFYFPDDDIIKWIAENRHLYHLSHHLALVSFDVINPLSQKELLKLHQLRDQIEAL